ncbi:MAG: hypothetical protein JWQ28_3050 [Pedobacter sp.]|jgi:hypothetical protein|nr:hypothetical protein [Pedobacter sp.]
MKTSVISWRLVLPFLLLFSLSNSGTAQEYVSLTQPAQSGMEPGAKAKLLSTNGPTKPIYWFWQPAMR